MMVCLRREHRLVLTSLYLTLWTFYTVDQSITVLIAEKHDADVPTGPTTVSKVSSALDNASERQEEESEEELAVFYNLYIAPQTEESALTTSLFMIREQLEQATKGYISNLGKNTTTVYYNTIGYKLSSEHVTWLRPEKLKLRHMNHYDEGFEEVTLQELHHYCQEHPSRRVVYLHNKGSYHPSKLQDRWRRHGTLAATSEDCIRPKNDSCNACGLLWQPVPSFHNAGNFWAAKCDYVSKLVPPNEFEKMFHRILSTRVFELLKAEQIHADLIQHQRKNTKWSLGRMAAEIWIGSHPDIVPCDLSEKTNIWYWLRRYRDEAEFKWSMFPRHNLLNNWNTVRRPHLKEILDHDVRRKTEYFLLPGMILRWQELYNQTPPADSWIWSFYPDGEMWKSAILEDSTLAVDKVTSLFRGMNPPGDRFIAEFRRDVLNTQ